MQCSGVSGEREEWRDKDSKVSKGEGNWGRTGRGGSYGSLVENDEGGWGVRRKENIAACKCTHWNCTAISRPIQQVDVMWMWSRGTTDAGEQSGGNICENGQAGDNCIHYSKSAAASHNIPYIVTTWAQCTCRWHKHIPHITDTSHSIKKASLHFVQDYYLHKMLWGTEDDKIMHTEKPYHGASHDLPN